MVSDMWLLSVEDPNLRIRHCRGKLDPRDREIDIIYLPISSYIGKSIYSAFL